MSPQFLPTYLAIAKESNSTGLTKAHNYTEARSPVRKHIAEFVRPMAVPAFPFRFRDNLVGAAIGHVPIDALQALYTRLYGLTLQ